MYVYNSHPDIKKTNNSYEDKKINSNKNSCNSNKYNSVYNNIKEKTYHHAYLNHNYSFNNIQKNHNFIYNRQLNNKTPYRHHHHLIYFHHHCHTPLSHSYSTSRSCSCSCSPSPIKNISQPLINTKYLNEVNNSNKVPNQNMYNYNYNHQNYNNKNSKSKFFNFGNITKANEYNNIYNRQIRDNEIDKNNSILYSNRFLNNDNEASFSNAKAFDEYMTKVAVNKYNKMKRFNESNYSSYKQIEEDLDYNSNTNNSNYNNESFINEYNLIKKNLEEKYKLYNLISKYDDINVNYKNINSNKFNSNINKNISNENYNEITKHKTNENIKEDLIIDKSYENEKIKDTKLEKNINKEKTQKISLNNDNKNKNKKHNYHHDKHSHHNNSNNNENDIANSSKLIETGFSPEIKRNENFSIIKDKYNKIDNIIQKTFNERIGPDSSNINNISSFYDKKKIFDKEDNNNDNGNDNNDNQNKNKENKNENNLFNYLAKENEELKKLNNSYKQLLDILFYFLNNISQKNQKENDESSNEINPSKLFDFSKDLNDQEGFSKKLINLEFLLNNNKDKYNNKENGNDSKKDNENDKNKLKIDNNASNFINNKDKINSLVLKITKENSIQLPELSKLVQFNNLIEGMNKKCFSFKDEDLIENFPHNNNKKYVKNNNINKNYIKIDNNNNKSNMLNIDNDKKLLDKQIIDKINNESDRCFACLLGCNVSKRGYSPMRYNPYTKNELRIDDSGYLLDRYNELKVSFDNENIDKFNKEKNIYHKIPKSNNNFKYNSLNNSRDNSKFVKKKIWK